MGSLLCVGQRRVFQYQRTIDRSYEVRHLGGGRPGVGGPNALYDAGNG